LKEDAEEWIKAYQLVYPKFEFSDNDVLETFVDFLESLYADDAFELTEIIKRLLHFCTEDAWNWDPIHFFFMKRHMLEDSLEAYKWALAARHYLIVRYDEDEQEFVQWAIRVFFKELTQGMCDGNLETVGDVLLMVSDDTVPALESYLSAQQNMYGILHDSGEYQILLHLIRGNNAL